MLNERKVGGLVTGQEIGIMLIEKMVVTLFSTKSATRLIVAIM